jgi:hypothetical protein
MTTALIGLLGVIVGVLVGGGVQVGVAWMERRAESRRAVRLLFGDCYFALNQLTNAAQGIWWDKATAPPLDGWRQHRAALAGAMDGPAFQTVDGAFQRVANIEKWRRTDEVADIEEDAREAAEQLEGACGLLLIEAFSGRERRRMEQEMEADRARRHPK